MPSMDCGLSLLFYYWYFVFAGAFVLGASSLSSKTSLSPNDALEWLKQILQRLRSL